MRGAITFGSCFFSRFCIPVSFHAWLPGAAHSPGMIAFLSVDEPPEMLMCNHGQMHDVEWERCKPCFGNTGFQMCVAPSHLFCFWWFVVQVSFHDHHRGMCIVQA